MSAKRWDTIALQIHIALLRVGVLPALLGLSVLFACATWAGLLLQLHAQSTQQITSTPAQQPAIVASTGIEKTIRTTANVNIQKFYAALGQRSTAEQDVQTLFVIAKKLELSLPQGEYKWQHDAASDSYRYQIIFPVKGTYVAVRQFCESALRALPYVALDEWSFRRESINEDEVDVTLHFTLYLKDSVNSPQPLGTMP
jgi:hypothetical protein